MKTFWVTFKLHVDKAVIEGDVVTEMPDDGKLTAEYLQTTKKDILDNIVAEMAKNGSLPKQTGNVLILACIPLEQ